LQIGDGVIRKYFQLQANATNVRREMIGGLTTFLTMAYIIFVNPAILSDDGMDRSALITATCLAALCGKVRRSVTICKLQLKSVICQP